MEAGTGKVSLLGLINAYTMAALPGRTERMRIFLYLVNGIGDYDMTVEVHDLAEDRVIIKTKAVRISFHNRLAALQLFLTIPALPILHPGKYDVIVLGNGNEIERQQFRVKVLEDEGEPK